jgi:hypothetical protein
MSDPAPAASVSTRLQNRAEEWIYQLNEQQHPIFRLYDWGNEVWAKLRFRGVRRRAAEFARTLQGKGDTAELRFLTPEDSDAFADLLARFDFKYLPPHPLDRENAVWALRRSSYLPYGIFYRGELVGYTLVRLFFPGRAVTGVWSIPMNHNRGFSQVAVKTTAEFTLAEGLSDYVTVPVDNPYSLKGAQWAGWKIVRTNRRFHVLRHH